MADDVVIPIAAKDAASKVLEQVGKNAQVLGKRVENLSADTSKSTKAMEGAFNGLKTAMGPLLAAFAAFKAATFSVSFLRESSAAFDVQQESVRGLAKALELAGETSTAQASRVVQSGNAIAGMASSIDAHANSLGSSLAAVSASASTLTKSVGEQSSSLAASLQDVAASVASSGNSVAQSVSQQSQAIAATKSTVDDVASLAAKLSEETGTSLSAAMATITSAVNGSAEALAEMSPAIRDSVQAIKDSGSAVASSSGDFESLSMSVVQSSQIASNATTRMAHAARQTVDAIKETSKALGPTIEEHQAFASALQGVVNVGDEVTLGLLKQASTLGVSNGKLQDTAKAAIGLAEATGMNLNEALKKVVGAVNGNSSALAEMIPSLRSVSTESERLAIIQQMASDGLQQAADRAQTAEGAATRLANSWGDFKEVIGQLLSPIKQVVSAGLATLVEVVSSAVIPALNAIMPSTQSVTAAMEAMRNGIIQAVTFVEVVLTNFGSIWEMVKASAELQVIAITESVKHSFVVAIPEYLNWFGDNFVNIVTDVFNAAVTVVENQIRKIAEIITKLWDWVKSGFDGGAAKLFADVGDIAARNMLEGFEAKTKALPTIAARHMTEREQELSMAVANIAGSMANEYGSKLKDRMAAAGQIAADSLKVSLDSNVSAAVEEVAEKASEQSKDIAKKASEATGAIQASESRLLARGSQDNITEQQLNENKQTNRLLEKQTRQFEKWLARQSERQDKTSLVVVS